MGSPLSRDFEDTDLGQSEPDPREDKTNVTILPVASRYVTKLARLTRTKHSDSIAKPNPNPPENLDSKRFSPYDMFLEDTSSVDLPEPVPMLTGFEHYSFYNNQKQPSQYSDSPLIGETHTARQIQDEIENHPYIVGDWIVNTVPCIIRGIGAESPIVSIRYPRGAKRRYFTYFSNQLVKVETVLGDEDKEKTRVVYAKELSSGAWHMLLDGITSRLPGEISLSDSGVFHVQVDDSGRCRREYPDGTTSVDMACSSHHKGAHALIRALMSEDDGSSGKNNRTVLDLLSVVSHDLRSPLTSVQGLLTLLSAGAFGDIPDKARERITSVESDLTRLTRLINELLDAEMLVSGKLVMRRQLIDVQDLFDAAVGSLSGLALQQRVQLSVIKSNLQLYADKDRLVRVLVNIVANAIKYSPRGATVVLSAEFNGDSVILKVKDSGRGIPTKYQKAIFERFQQVSEGDWSEKGGVGLGL
ncbi:MAG: HAMP domain-containing histidine kinase, partial [Candidatus Obscuribacterales bacterium]|nr:HAMP domain-containing histidine kinase [Candidatus Obscuribacterales bacterium]